MPDSVKKGSTPDDLRDRFAMAALRGLLNDLPALNSAARKAEILAVDMAAGSAYEFADAMLRARKRNNRRKNDTRDA